MSPRPYTSSTGASREARRRRDARLRVAAQAAGTLFLASLVVGLGLWVSSDRGRVELSEFWDRLEIIQPPAPPIDEALRQLHLDLERHYGRAMYKNGFEINYKAAPPRTIIVTLRYYPGSKEERLGREVAQGAAQFARSMGQIKYGISGLATRVDLVALERRGD